eukprot:15113078-Ditylum_brightwellii.AAC.1
MYIVKNTHPDIAFAVNQCAHHTHQPTGKHAQYLKQIRRYLLATQDKGMILKPLQDQELQVDCYINADFAGLWHVEDNQDPYCVCSQTGFIITVADCAVVWKSALLSVIVQSTMEAKYFALSTACRDLLPLKNLLEEVSVLFGLTKEKETIHTMIWENNEQSLQLVTTKLPRTTPQLKHFVVHYHWCRALIPSMLEVKSILTADQQGDLFTKGLHSPVFTNLEQANLGW